MTTEIVIVEHNGQKIAHLNSADVEVRSVRDALDLIGNADYMGARALVVAEHHFDPRFYDLSSGMAGEIVQKFSTYGVKLAIVGEFGHYGSKSLNAFIHECNRGNLIFFGPDTDSAIEKLVKGAAMSSRGYAG
jgi:hypothetical protein